jgi:signal transduction histidine kinase
VKRALARRATGEYVVTRRVANGVFTTLLLAAGYVLAGKVAFALAFAATSIAPVWLPSGLAVAAVLLRGYRMAPGIAVGAFVFNAMTPVPLWTSAAIAVGNMSEALLAALLLRRIGLRAEMDRTRDVLAFAGLAAGVSTAVSATGGVFSLWAAGVLTAAAAGGAWLLWWSGDAVGVLTVTPLLLLARSPRTWRRPPRGRLLEGSLLGLAVLLVSWAGLATRLVGPFVVFPVLAWAGMRFRVARANLASLCVAAAAVWATGHGHGPFVAGHPRDDLLLTQSFVAVVMLTGLLLAALSAERERVNQQLRTAIAEIGARNDELRRSNSELQELDRLKDSFVATVSHELRTPLTSIRGYAEILAEGQAGLLSDRARRAVATIEDNGARLQSLIENLLTISTVEIVPMFERHLVDLASVVTRACERAQPAIARGRLRLVTDLPDVVPPVYGDTEQLDRVLDNLLSNAVKFSPDGGVVTVRVQHDHRAVTVEVIDTGIGIPADEQASLFTRFFRSSLARQLTIRGTGLGLAISKAIVEAHGGRIEVSSTVGLGTTMAVALPLSEVDGSPPMELTCADPRDARSLLS